MVLYVWIIRWSGIIKVESTNSPKYDRTKAKERREKGPTTKK